MRWNCAGTCDETVAGAHEHVPFPEEYVMDDASTPACTPHKRHPSLRTSKQFRLKGRTRHHEVSQRGNFLYCALGWISDNSSHRTVCGIYLVRSIRLRCVGQKSTLVSTSPERFLVVMLLCRNISAFPPSPYPRLRQIADFLIMPSIPLQSTPESEFTHSCPFLTLVRINVVQVSRTTYARVLIKKRLFIMGCKAGVSGSGHLDWCPESVENAFVNYWRACSSISLFLFFCNHINQCSRSFRQNNTDPWSHRTVPLPEAPHQSLLRYIPSIFNANGVNNYRHRLALLAGHAHHSLLYTNIECTT